MECSEFACFQRSSWPSGQDVRRSRRKSRVRLLPVSHVRTIFLIQQLGYPHPVCSELLPEWRSVRIVSLNVGGGVRLIKPAKLYMCTQNITNATRTDARRRVCAAMVHTTEPRGKCRYENWITTTTFACFPNK